jgi:hypothetical protein
MEAGDIGTEPEPDGSGSPEEFGENVEVDSAAIEQETQDFQDNLGSVGGDAAEDQKKKDVTKFKDAINKSVKDSLGKAYSDIGGEGSTEEDFNNAWDALSSTLDEVGETFDPADNEETKQDKINKAYEKAITELKQKMSLNDSVRKGLNDLARAGKGIKSKLWNGMKDLFNDNLKTQVNTEIENISKAFDGAGKPDLEALEKSRNKIDKILNDSELTKKIDESTSSKEEAKDKKKSISDYLKYALGLGTIAGLIWAYCQYVSDTSTCYQMEGTSSGPVKNPLTDIPNSGCSCISPSTSSIVPKSDCSPTTTTCCPGVSSTDQKKSAVCVHGLCTTFSYNAGKTYTYTPKSLGGFLGNLIDNVVVNPGGDLLNKIGSFFNNLLKGPIKWIIIVLIIGTVIYLGFKLFLSRPQRSSIPQYVPQYVPQQIPQRIPQRIPQPVNNFY